MAGPRYTNPGGFGGAYDEPAKGEFQPGTEEGVEDPNAGRVGATICNPQVRPAARIFIAQTRPAARMYTKSVMGAGAIYNKAVSTGVC